MTAPGSQPGAGAGPGLLAAASKRLAKAPGRPRTRPVPDDGVGDRAVVRRTSAQPPEPLPMRVRASTWAPLGPRLLAKVDAGRYLGVSPRTIDNLVASGKLVPVRLLNRRLLFDRHALDQLVGGLSQRTRCSGASMTTRSSPGPGSGAARCES